MKNSFYFDHDYNARNDQKILELRAEFGWEGYGIFFALLECLCESKGFINMEALAGLSLGLSIPKDRLKLILDFCVKTGLLNENKNEVYSNRILEHLQYRQKLSEYGSLGGRTNKATLKPGLNSAQAPPQAGKESKGENSIGKKSKVKKSKEINNGDFVFETFWDLYDKKVGDKKKVQKIWVSLKQDERNAIMAILPEYVESFDDNQFQPYPQTYLNQRRWENEPKRKIKPEKLSKTEQNILGSIRMREYYEQEAAQKLKLIENE